MRYQLQLTTIFTFIVCIFTDSAAIAKEIATSDPFFVLQSVEEKNVSEDIQSEIECISNQIELWKYKDESNSKLLGFYNSRGVRYFCLGLFEDALNDFNHVLDVLYDSQSTSDPLFALALWGRLLCHAYQDLEDEALQDLDIFQNCFLSECLPCENSKADIIDSSNSRLITKNYFPKFQDAFVVLNHFSSSRHINILDIRPIAQFANPNERISSGECKERVKGTADLMRLITARIPNGSLVAAINFAICQLEDIMYNCCNRNHWTECLTPIIDAYQYMKKCMDKGAQIAPKIIWPGR